MARIKHVGYSLREDFELTRIRTYYDAFGDDIAEESSIDVALRDSLVVRKKDFLSLSGFDKNIGAPKYQDVDLCLRAKQQSFEIVAYSPAVLIVQNEFVRPSIRWEPLNSSEHAVRRQFVEAHQHIQAEIGSLIK
jgi:GT2 family glycosyltransferase